MKSKACTKCGKDRPLLVSVTETARLLGISCASMYEIRKSHALPRPVRVAGRWLYDREKLEMWIRLECPSQPRLEILLKAERRKRVRKRCKAIADSYVRQVLCDKNSLTHKDIPQELVELKREHIKLKRKLKEKQS